MLEFLEIGLSNNIAIFVIMIMFFFSLFLILEIKKLKNEIEYLKYEDKAIFQKYSSDYTDDIVSIGMISDYQDDDCIGCSKVFEQSSGELEFKGDNMEFELGVIGDSCVDNRDSVVEINNGFGDNIVSIGSKEIKIEDVEKEVLIDTDNNSNVVLGNDIDVISESVISLEESVIEKNDESFVEKESFDNSVLTIEDDKEVVLIDKIDLDDLVSGNNSEAESKISDNNVDDYLSQISRQMAEELKPQTIELTDYEKEQEDNAIISYQELLSVKNNIDVLDEFGEDIDFIEELKKLRNSLN